MDCISEGSTELLRSRIEDTVRLCDKRCAPCFLGFLDLREQAIARGILASLGITNWAFSGGYDSAERAILSIFPDYLEADLVEYPLSAISFAYRASHVLTHRDFLGTLLSAGIRRETIGDILCGSGLSVAFVREEIATFVCEQITKVGGEGVRVTAGYAGPLPVAHTYQEIHETVASPRLDAVVKALIRTSRESAAQLIRIGSVSVDHLPQDSVSATISAPCTVSVRGYGRYLIDAVGPETKKGRLQLFARKCI